MIVYQIEIIYLLHSFFSIMVTSDHFCNNCGLRFGNEESLKMHDCEEVMAEPEDSGSEYEILSDDELFSDNDDVENNINHEEGNSLMGIVI